MGRVAVYTVGKRLSDAATAKRAGRGCTAKDVTLLIDHNADVYTEEGRLLLRFRKSVLSAQHNAQFYDAVHDFVQSQTSKLRNMHTSEPKSKVRSSIMGYYDRWNQQHYKLFRELGVKAPPSTARATLFTMEHADKWQQAVPLVQEVDKMYRKLHPAEYRAQRALADQTGFRIPGTAFTTVTVNLNYKTLCHRDKGDFEDGFGNLVVIEKGKYAGGLTVFPQYGVGVDCRTRDFLSMDAHELHGNTPIVAKEPGAQRMSLVCYLRKRVWEVSRGTTAKDALRSAAQVRRLLARRRSMKKQSRGSG